MSYEFKTLRDLKIEKMSPEYLTKDEATSYNNITNRNYSVQEGDLKRIAVLISIVSDKDGLLTREVFINTPRICESPRFYGGPFVDIDGHKTWLHEYNKEDLFILDCILANEIGSKYPDDFNKLKEASNEFFTSVLEQTKDIKKVINEGIRYKDKTIYPRFYYNNNPKNIFESEAFKYDADYNDNLFSLLTDIAYEEEIKKAYDYENNAIQTFYKEHIEGKSLSEIDPDTLQFYSDWHKDVYGFRPHGNAKCGEYVNPHTYYNNSQEQEEEIEL